MKTLKTILISVVVICVMALIVILGFKVNELDECHTWRDQATHFKDYYVTQWQVDQCANYEIKIDAPVWKN